MPAERIVLFGHFSGSNLGNSATFASFVDELRRRQPDARIECVSTKGPYVESEHCIAISDVDPLPIGFCWRIPFRPLRNFCTSVVQLITEPLRRRRAVNFFRGASELIVVGTGILDDLGVGPCDMPLHIYRWCRAARTSGARIRFLSIGAGPIVNPISRALMCRALRVADSVTYRDEVSRNYMQRRGLDVTGHSICPDLVFGFPPGRLPSHQPTHWPPRVVGVGVMNYSGWNRGKSAGRTIYEAYVDKISSFIEWLVRRDYSVRLLTGEVADGRTVDDVRAAILRRSSALLDRVAYESLESYRDLLQQIAATDVVVATRYHNIICSLLMARPAISLSYHDKNDEVMRNAGLGEYCQHVETFEFDELVRQFEQLTHQPAALSGRLASHAARQRQLLEEQYDAVFGPPCVAPANECGAVAATTR